MEYGLIIGGMLLAFVVASLYKHLQSRKRAQKLLVRQHLIEIAEKIQELQQNLHQTGYASDAPPVFQTSQGLIITYMQSQHEALSLFLHNFSVVSTSISWHASVQKQLIAYICNLIGASSPTSIQYSTADVLHFSFMLETEEENQNFLRSTIDIPEFPRAFLRLSEPLKIEEIDIAVEE